MTNNYLTLIGKILQKSNRSYQLTLILLGLFFSPQILAQNTITSDYTDYKLIIDQLVCRGNENTQCEFIIKKYYQSIGDFVDPDEIADARLRLGTLQQFKNVTVTLEKAKQRGHVNVVFLVDEAQHIQYSLSSRYQGRDSGWLRSDHFSQFAGVTDFNFLGSGKELSFGVNAYYAETDIPSYNNNYSHGYNANLSYYDPHLNNTVNYFLTASISHSINDIARLENKAVVSSYSLSLGRRFASYSYVSFGAYDNSGVEDGSLFLAYGWDSTDDKIFATKGSEFNTSIATSLDGDSISLSLNYLSHIRLSDTYVLGYQVSNMSYLKHPIFEEHRLDPHMSIFFSDIDSSRGVSGKYTGWRYQISSPLRDIDTNTLTFGVSYIYQTDALIISLSLNYQPDFGGE